MTRIGLIDDEYGLVAGALMVWLILLVNRRVMMVNGR